MDAPLKQQPIKLLAPSSLFVCDSQGVCKLSVNSLLIQPNTCYSRYKQNAFAIYGDTQFGSRPEFHPHPYQGGAFKTVAPSICKKTKKKPPLHPLVVFQLNEIIFPRLEAQSGSEGLCSACCLLCVQKRRQSIQLGTDGCLCQARY